MDHQAGAGGGGEERVEDEPGGAGVGEGERLRADYGIDECQRAEVGGGVCGQGHALDGGGDDVSGGAVCSEAGCRSRLKGRKKQNKRRGGRDDVSHIV